MYLCDFWSLRTLLLLVSASVCAATSILQFEQHVLSPPRTYRTLQPNAPHISKYLDAAPNSVGLLLTTAGGEGEEVIHLWLPLGKRIYARETPYLPVHPLTARITTMVASTPERASTEYLDAIECRLYPAFRAPAQISDLKRKEPEQLAAISFSRAHDLVHLAEFGVDGWEVEAYECS